MQAKAQVVIALVALTAPMTAPLQKNATMAQVLQMVLAMAVALQWPMASVPLVLARSEPGTTVAMTAAVVPTLVGVMLQRAVDGATEQRGAARPVVVLQRPLVVKTAVLQPPQRSLNARASRGLVHEFGCVGHRPSRPELSWCSQRRVKRGQHSRTCNLTRMASSRA